MNVTKLNVTQDQAREALIQYKQHRNIYDKRDWEIERIYREIARGNQVISAFDSIRAAGVDGIGRPRLAIMRADEREVVCDYYYSDRVIFTNTRGSKAAERHFEIPWPNRPARPARPISWNATALLPRIPPQHRPTSNALSGYHILWEADWQDIPRDPYLLKRIGKDAWVVLAAWDLTDVEVNVLRSRPTQ